MARDPAVRRVVPEQRAAARRRDERGPRCRDAAAGDAVRRELGEAHAHAQIDSTSAGESEKTSLGKPFLVHLWYGILMCVGDCACRHLVAVAEGDSTTTLASRLLHPPSRGRPVGLSRFQRPQPAHRHLIQMRWAGCLQPLHSIQMLSWGDAKLQQHCLIVLAPQCIHVFHLAVFVLVSSLLPCCFPFTYSHIASVLHTYHAVVATSPIKCYYD